MEELDIPSAEELKAQIDEYRRNREDREENEQKLEIKAVFDKRDPTQTWMKLILNRPLLPHFLRELEHKGYSVVVETICYGGSTTYLIGIQ